MANIVVEISELEQLEARVTEEWRGIFATSPFVNAIQDGSIPRSLYGAYLFETYHYTRHNSRNQALVGVASPDDDPYYQRFCFEHAADELGHEQMALHDLKSLGAVELPSPLPTPLAATTTLIAYLYWISFQGNPLQRLGYSYWAENCYGYVRPLLGKVKESLGLSSVQMTFFDAHSELDVEHSKRVNEMLNLRCKTSDDWLCVAEVMTNSLRLTGRMMDEVYAEHGRWLQGGSKRYSFLKAL